MISAKGRITVQVESMNEEVRPALLAPTNNDRPNSADHGHELLSSIELIDFFAAEEPQGSFARDEW